MSSEKMILFDYSGTLSLEAPLFAGPDFLMQQLEECGLRAFGIDSPHIFWDKIINPTWVEGSTTAVGYKKVLQDAIIATLHPDLSVRRRFSLTDAVAAFVDRYLRHSRIDPRWKPILRKINAYPAIKAFIATDHYAEATGAIIKFLGKWQIRAVTATEAALNPQAASFIVANSADMGVHKADPRFWQILKTSLRLDAMRRILIIDDFGYNEQGADNYSDQQKVDARIKETIMTLETVFSAAIEVFSVMIGTDDERDRRLENLFEEVTVVIDRFLRSIGPIVDMAKAVETLKPLGFADTSDSVPWREAYSEYSEAQLIGKALAGARYRKGLTQIQLSELTGIPQRHISEMENGKRPIGKEMAKRLGKALNVGYKVFL